MASVPLMSYISLVIFCIQLSLHCFWVSNLAYICSFSSLYVLMHILYEKKRTFKHRLLKAIIDSKVLEIPLLK